MAELSSTMMKARGAVLAADLASESGAAMVGVPGGLKLSDALDVRWSSQDPAFLAVVLGDTHYSAASIGYGGVLVGAVVNGQRNRLPGTRQYRTILGGYDNEIGDGGVSGGCNSCAIVASNHSQIQGDVTHALIAGGSYNQILSGDYGNIVGGTLNVIRDLRMDGVTPVDSNTTTIGGGYGNLAAGGNVVIAGGRGNIADGGTSTIGGGSSNLTGGSFDVVAGGNSNETRSGGNGTSQKNTIGGGRYNVIDSVTTSISSTIAGGESNNIFGTTAFIGGGINNAIGTPTVNATSGTIGGGNGNAISGSAGTIAGGRDNIVSSDYATVTGGQQNKATNLHARATGMQADARHSTSDTIGCGAFSVAGDAQSSVVVRKVESTTASWTPFSTIVMPDNSAMAFDVLIVGRRSDASNESAAYRLTGCIDRNSGAGSAALVGTVTKQDIAEDSPAWDVRAIANTGVGGLQIQVMGEAGKTIRWVARATLAEVSG